MPIDSEALALHIEEHGPFLFHVTDASHREVIMRDGLRPGSDLGRYVRDDFYRTRPGRVYMCDRERGIPVVPVEGERMILQIDLRQLEPACFDTDEDVPANQQRFQGKRWFDVDPPDREMAENNCDEAPGQAGRLAAWAESIEGFDEPQFVARSLAAGRVAYRGTIPPTALTVVQPRSGVVEAFARAAHDLLGIDDVGPIPALDFCEVESDRAFVVAEQVLEGGLHVLGCPLSATDTDLSDPTRAYYLADRIRRFGYERNRQGDWGPRDFAFALADLATAVYDYDRAMGWDPQACAAIGAAAAAVLPHVAKSAGADLAVSLACGAVRATTQGT